jgi:hypothetical protein
MLIGFVNVDGKSKIKKTIKMIFGRGKLVFKQICYISIYSIIN